MKDRSTKEKPLLGQTIESIGLMYRSLQSLYRDEYPVNPMTFAILAEGEIDQIRDLLDDLDWIMEDLIPQQLRENVAEPREVELVALEEAA
jgi:hypothetical protein